jgi:hypothetical protein
MSCSQAVRRALVATLPYGDLGARPVSISHCRGIDFVERHLTLIEETIP